MLPTQEGPGALPGKRGCLLGILGQRYSLDKRSEPQTPSAQVGRPRTFRLGS